jgi:hypothetical protein
VVFPDPTLTIPKSRSLCDLYAFITMLIKEPYLKYVVQAQERAAWVDGHLGKIVTLAGEFGCSADFMMLWKGEFELARSQDCVTFDGKLQKLAQDREALYSILSELIQSHDGILYTYHCSKLLVVMIFASLDVHCRSENMRYRSRMQWKHSSLHL